MISLTWEQVRAWRLEQHFLTSRLGRGDFVQAVKRVLGVQAQVMSAAELAIGARVDGLTRADVQGALWEDHTLVKTWAMRGTIHVFAAEDLPMIVAARCVKGGRHRLQDFLNAGFSETQYDEFLVAVRDVLGEEPITREELATGVAERMKAPEVKKALLGSSWGTLWKPSMYRGEMCFGPSEGRTKTFVNPRKWLREWKEWDAKEAQREITRRYLRVYGPTTAGEYSSWWNGGGSSYGKEMLALLGDEVEVVSVEGWKATALKSTIEEIANVEVKHSVRLVPMFDVYVLTQSHNLGPLLDIEHKSKVFRPAAWVSAGVLVEGRVEGVWEHETKKEQTVVKVAMFGTANKKVRGGIEAEAERLGGFLGTKVSVEFVGGE